MSADSAVGLIAYPSPPDSWIREVAATVSGDFLLIVSDSPDGFEAPYADVLVDSSNQIGFGRARRLSMILASEFGVSCVVADGDGQYTAASVRSIEQRLTSTDADVVIPQRESRSVWIEHNGDQFSRKPFERLETLCAAQAAGVELQSDFDCQPGGFGFQRDVLADILPAGDWLADWEITVKTLQNCHYETISVTVNEDEQHETTFEWDNQIRKLERIRHFGVDVAAVYEQNEARFDSTGRKLVCDALEEINIGDV